MIQPSPWRRLLMALDVWLLNFPHPLQWRAVWKFLRKGWEQDG